MQSSRLPPLQGRPYSTIFGSNNNNAAGATTGGLLLAPPPPDSSKDSTPSPANNSRSPTVQQRPKSKSPGPNPAGRISTNTGKVFPSESDPDGDHLRDLVSFTPRAWDGRRQPLTSDLLALANFYEGVRTRTFGHLPSALMAHHSSSSRPPPSRMGRLSPVTPSSLPSRPRKLQPLATSIPQPALLKGRHSTFGAFPPSTSFPPATHGLYRPVNYTSNAASWDDSVAIVENKQRSHPPHHQQRRKILQRSSSFPETTFPAVSSLPLSAPPIMTTTRHGQSRQVNKQDQLTSKSRPFLSPLRKSYN